MVTVGSTPRCAIVAVPVTSNVACEDERCRLLGDSFSIYSFVIFAWGVHAGDVIFASM